MTRSFTNPNKITNFTAAINEIPNQYGLLNGMGLFTERFIGSTSVTFDKIDTTVALMSQVPRSTHEATYGKDIKVKTFALPTTYFYHKNSITAEDLQDWRRPDTDGEAETLANVRAEKLADLRMTVDQTMEYMKMTAITGVCTDPDGEVVADMFSEFGATQIEIDFELGTATTDIDGKISELYRAAAGNAKQGSSIRDVMVLVGKDFFDKFVAHEKIRSSYNNYLNTGMQKNRDRMAEFRSWGVVNMYDHRGLVIMEYNPLWTLNDGTTTKVFGDNEGYAIVEGVTDLYRAYYGPSNKLSGANQGRAAMYADEYTDPRDRFHEMEVETAPLFLMTRPLLSIKVTTSN